MQTQCQLYGGQHCQVDDVKTLQKGYVHDHLDSNSLNSVRTLIKSKEGERAYTRLESCLCYAYEHSLMTRNILKCV